MAEYLRWRMDDPGGYESLWACQECGAMVGPGAPPKARHDLWHARVATKPAGTSPGKHTSKPPIRPL